MANVNIAWLVSLGVTTVLYFGFVVAVVVAIWQITKMI